MITKTGTDNDPRLADGQMKKDRGARWLILVCLSGVLMLILTVSGYAQQPQKTTKRSKPSKKTQAKAAPPAIPMVLEPKAMEIIKAACDRLAAAKSMRFTAVVTYEHPSRLGPPLAYTTKSDVTMQRPDKLRVITAGDGPASEFYYDGKQMVAYAPAEKLVAVTDAPPTIDAALKKAFETAAIYYPFADVVVADPYKDLSEGLKLAFYIGQSNVVGGVTTDMLAYVNDVVFVQAWVGAEDKLPRRLRAMYRDDTSRLRHQLDLSGWQLDVPVSAEEFTLGNIGSLAQIPFARPDTPPQGLKPPAKSQAKPKSKPKAKPPAQ